MAPSKAGDESPRLYKFNGILMYVGTYLRRAIASRGCYVESRRENESGKYIIWIPHQIILCSVLSSD